MDSRYETRQTSVRRAGKSISQYRHVILTILLLLSSLPAFAQTGVLAPVPVQQWFDNSGNECASCKLYWYVCGTTTNRTVYTTSALSTAHSQPITLNSAGRPPNNSAVYLTPGVCHKAVLKTSADVEIWSADNMPGSGLQTSVASTETGSVNDWTVGLGNVVVFWAGASDLTVTGFSNGVEGQTITLKNTGSAVAYFVHNSSSSSSGNRLINVATSGNTPVAPGGSITYVNRAGADWRLLSHEQGAWITPTFAAGTYTASSGNWTVASTDVATQAYRLSGRTVTAVWSLGTTTVSTTPATLSIGNAAWGGFTSTAGVRNAAPVIDNSTITIGQAFVSIGDTRIFLIKADGSNWAAATDTSGSNGQLTFQVD